MQNQVGLYLLGCSLLPGILLLEIGITDEYITNDGKYNAGADKCYEESECDPDSKYREVSGACNNLGHPSWGIATSPYLRLLPAHYADGVYEVRLGENGTALRSTRDVSVHLFPNNLFIDMKYTWMSTMWGQVVAHDIVATSYLVPLGCCNEDGSYPEQELHPGCLPIHVAVDDPVLSRQNVTCMHYSRLFTTDDQHICSLTPRQQIVDASPYMDMSQVYGGTEEAASQVRSFQGGKLKTVTTPDGKETLPHDQQWRPFCRLASPNQSCLIAGDDKINQNPMLGAMLTLLAKEHNRLAVGLHEVNPSWDDETLYQEARRILIAQAQHITYSEYLPTIISSEYSKGLALEPQSSGYTQYNESLRVGTLAAFGGAIFRIFHSTVRGHIDLAKTGRLPRQCGGTAAGCSCPKEFLLFSDNWWAAGGDAIDCYEEILESLIETPTAIPDVNFSPQMMNFYQKDGKNYGDDLVALDIMRGRDMGLPPYNQYRKLCGLTTFSSFEDLNGVVRPQIVPLLKDVYDSVEDIDLYVGAISELAEDPAYMGPTAQCILAQQFALLKYGDRFFYEHQGQPASFTQDQLESIRNTSLASILCANEGATFGTINQDTFLLGDIQLTCDEVHTVDLELWKFN